MQGGRVEDPQNRRCTKGQGLLRKEGPFLRAFEKPAFGELSKSFQRAFVEPAFGELLESPLSESFGRAFRELS